MTPYTLVIYPSGSPSLLRAALFVLLPLGVLFATLASADEVFVEVQKAQIKSAPKAWAEPIGEVKYGDKLEILDRQAPWIKVRTQDNREGFVHNTAISNRQLALKSDVKVNAQLDIPDAVLAGKGFSEIVASKWEKSNPQANFAFVESMSKHSDVAYKDLFAFMKSGGLNVGDEK